MQRTILKNVMVDAMREIIMDSFYIWFSHKSTQYSLDLVLFCFAFIYVCGCVFCFHVCDTRLCTQLFCQAL